MTVDAPTWHTMPRAAWMARRDAYLRRIDAFIEPHLRRRRDGIAHPVEDFLFTYYSFRPTRLRRFHPGAGITVLDVDPSELGRWYVATHGGARLDPTLALRRQESIRLVRELLAGTATRTPQLGCFGMHEWAMVYRQDQELARHAAWPLRLGPTTTARVVERAPLRCSHVDAYRFFTSPARPLNLLNPTRASQAEDEQPGCLHANMDLYKWAYKLSPLVASELLADCFELAREIRELDMRASPYDLAALGYPPVPVETSAGRAEYAMAQREFAERAAPLRARLIDACDGLLG